ncbi:hypothetical protein HispidOSU_014678, partial [Sigmodon hispidus]
ESSMGHSIANSIPDFRSSFHLIRAIKTPTPVELSVSPSLNFQYHISVVSFYKVKCIPPRAFIQPSDD